MKYKKKTSSIILNNKDINVFSIFAAKFKLLQDYK